MKINVKEKRYTHEGGNASIINPEQMLRRSVMSCMLWENEFYEDGLSISDRIVDLAKKVKPEIVNAMAVEARNDMKVRHVSLLLATIHPEKNTINHVVQRADELAELIAIYWRNGKKPIPAQMKKGLALAFRKFDAYQLAKYNRDGAVKLRDVMFMVHPKPFDDKQKKTWSQLVDGTLASPDTWEVSLSAGADKKETFTRLLSENKLGAMALLRNLRNMIHADVDRNLVRSCILNANYSRVLPFRFVAAARHAPDFEPELDIAMQKSIDALPKLTGKTVVLVDVSGSMDCPLSGKSDMNRMDAAAALGAIVKSDELSVYTFSYDLVKVPPRRGMAGVDAIKSSQSHGGTYLSKSLRELNQKESYDRIIVITDEQSHDGIGAALPGSKRYLINVASNKNGVGYGLWVHLDGFSENVIQWIHKYEK